MSSGPMYLGIKTQNPVLGVTSTSPGTANAIAAAQQIPQNQPQPQVQPGKWNQGQGTTVIEVPWHKATPNMKNIN